MSIADFRSHLSRAERPPRRTWLGAAAALWLCQPRWAGAAGEADEQPTIVELSVAGAQFELQFTPDFSDTQRERARRVEVPAAEVVAR
jgi:hypothetical protein